MGRCSFDFCFLGACSDHLGAHVVGVILGVLNDGKLPSKRINQ